MVQFSDKKYKWVQSRMQGRGGHSHPDPPSHSLEFQTLFFKKEIQLKTGFLMKISNQKRKIKQTNGLTEGNAVRIQRLIFNDIFDLDNSHYRSSQIFFHIIRIKIKSSNDIIRNVFRNKNLLTSSILIF